MVVLAEEQVVLQLVLLWKLVKVSKDGIRHLETSKELAFFLAIFSTLCENFINVLWTQSFLDNECFLVLSLSISGSRKNHRDLPLRRKGIQGQTEP